MRTFLLVFSFLAAVAAYGQDYKNWVKDAPRLKDDFFLTDSAIRVAENVLCSQLPTGAWPKNINFFHDREKNPNDVMLGTIDNDATFTEIRFLLRLYNARKSYLSDAQKSSVTDTQESAELGERALTAARRGIMYLLEMQYNNGGFPQYYPRKDHYHARITFNDNAMVNALKMMRSLARRETPFEAVADDVAERCGEAFERGVACILRCQIKKDGQPSVWCQQHDEVTLAPCGARTFELPSYVSAESVNIVQLLMSIENPSDSVKNAVNGAMKWFADNALIGYERQNFTDSLGRKDYRMVECPQGDYRCPRLWSRFNDLHSGKPIFCGRDGVARPRVEMIDYERRNGYAWFGTQPEKLFPLYEKWKNRVQ